MLISSKAKDPCLKRQWASILTTRLHTTKISRSGVQVNPLVMKQAMRKISSMMETCLRGKDQWEMRKTTNLFPKNGWEAGLTIGLKKRTKLHMFVGKNALTASASLVVLVSFQLHHHPRARRVTYQQCPRLFRLQSSTWVVK